MQAAVSEENFSNNIVEVRTVQASAFKTLIEALKELLTETTIKFDETGIKIMTVDNSKVVLVHVKLDAHKFEYFKCTSKITIGLNMLDLFKLVRTINNSDTLTLFVEANDRNNLGIKIENSEKNSKTTYKLFLLDLDDVDYVIGDSFFDSSITLPSVDFQKICRDMNNLGIEYVDIKNVGNQLTLSCAGDFCSQETILVDNESGVNCIPNVGDEIVQGVFKLKYLVLFTKCTSLCQTVELFLKNDYPLLIQYMVADLGEAKLAITPKADL